MAMVCGKYACDYTDCRSTVELADALDLKQPEPALKKRGWVTYAAKDGKPARHLCQAHAPMVHKEGWTKVLETIETGTGV